MNMMTLGARSERRRVLGECHLRLWNFIVVFFLFFGEGSRDVSGVGVGEGKRWTKNGRKASVKCWNGNTKMLYRPWTFGSLCNEVSQGLHFLSLSQAALSLVRDAESQDACETRARFRGGLNEARERSPSALAGLGKGAWCPLCPSPRRGGALGPGPRLHSHQRRHPVCPGRGEPPSPCSPNTVTSQGWTASSQESPPESVKLGGQRGPSLTSHLHCHFLWTRLSHYKLKTWICQEILCPKNLFLSIVRFLCSVSWQRGQCSLMFYGADLIYFIRTPQKASSPPWVGSETPGVAK